MSKFYLLFRRYLTVMLVCGAFAGFAQDRTVTGKVTASEDGSSLPGVNINEKGTSNGTVSDADGNFKISVGANATLVFTFVGYATQEVAVGSQTAVNVSLVSDVKALNEVLVVGYGSQDKKEITGAAVGIDTKDFNKGNINDPASLLQGKVAGLSIYNKGGDPNASPVIRLRGLSTVGSNQQPLIVVDGVLGASLDNVDPADIASYTVLKDGSAAAIYGSRGSSGVILVTTKRGNSKGGSVNVDYNAYVSSASVYKQIPVMTPDQYIAAGGNNLGSKTNWQKQVTQTGVSNVHNLSISGGNSTTSFRISANFRNVNGVLKYSGFDRSNLRANLTHNALDGKLKFDLNMGFTNQNSNFSFNEALRYASLYNPTAPVYFPNGDYYQAILFDNFNPVAILKQNTNGGKKKNINYSAKVDYQVVKNLTLTINYAQQFDDVLNGEYYSSKSLFRGLNRNGLARRYTSDHAFTLFEGYGSYSKTISKLDLAASAGYSYQEDKFADMFVELGNFPSDALGYNALQNSGDRISGLAANVNINSSASAYKIIAGFARVNLMWDNAIFFNASVRREGSTKLGASHRWGSFPSIGAGVDLNHYLKLSSFNLLKFRVGYGVTGSLPSQSGLSQNQYSYSLNGGGGVIQSQIGNANLKWEQKAETNLGVEFGTGKFTGTVDAYSRDIKDFILAFVPDAVNNPNTSSYRNAGSLNTKGIEFTLNYNNLQFGEFSWSPGLVLSHYKTVLKTFPIDRAVRADFGAPGQNGTSIDIVAIGQPIGQIWGPVFAGVNANGSPKFADLNGDGIVDASPSDALLKKGDFKVLGNGIPSVELGWNNRLTFRNWDASVFFRAALGHSLVNQFRAFYEPIDPGAINSYNRVITKKAVAGLTSAQYSSLYVEKADFIKLDNMSIGYTFKLGSSAIKKVRLYVTGQNLFVITKYTGIDPEPVLQDAGSSDNGGFVSTTTDPLAPGIDRRNNYFTARTFTFGLNVGF